jgi:hypothetical protein
VNNASGAILKTLSNTSNASVFSIIRISSRPLFRKDGKVLVLIIQQIAEFVNRVGAVSRFLLVFFRNFRAFFIDTGKMEKLQMKKESV